MATGNGNKSGSNTKQHGIFRIGTMVSSLSLPQAAQALLLHDNDGNDNKNDNDNDTIVLPSSLIPPWLVVGDTPVLSNVRLHGTFPTASWNQDPNMPAFCAYHNYKIGAYYVATFDLLFVQAATTMTTTTTTSLPCVAIINRGDGDCNSGYWGVISRQQQQQQKSDKKKQYQVIAHIQSTGDTETTITQQSHDEKSDDDDMSLLSRYTTQVIAFPENQPQDEHNDEDECPYFDGLSPGICRTNLEKILGIAVHVIMASASHYWRRLPKTGRNE